MKLCRNCRTINADDAKVCAKCKMPDQLVAYNPEKTREWKESMQTKNNAAPLQNVCKNCGTPDYGSGNTCARCHFPISIRTLDGDGLSGRFANKYSKP